ncbi:putative dehydrogenase [Rhodoligotrophos appendicifer]|uniref:Gfo/Idh/MocA family protein n=1 Tax=Rhodoligotrophos appendicifer TaxID=987056 RepID=UPI00117EC4A9|nr:Gfo/Idh/MocA family oxidoreductase [Rhodoligotrophos appendicifer]
MHRIRIIGAGSIGNHLAHAARSRGWAVVLTDNDPAALDRARDSIYPQRYGAWDAEIELTDSASALADAADLVFIGTPPDSHIALAMATLDQAKTKAILIEKPVCGPDLAGCQDLFELGRAKGVFLGVGYNHTLGRNTIEAETIIASGMLGRVSTISASIREHWAGIFQAHPWLSGPAASYLGFSTRGGGAAGEHSHGFNIWQHFAHVLGAGKVAEVTARLEMVEENGCNYDRLCFATLKTEEGLMGDVLQDVVTAPSEKRVRIQGEGGYVDWRIGYRPGADAVLSAKGAEKPDELIIEKTRPDDFKAEIAHMEQVLEGKVTSSPISLERGLDTMMVIAAAFKSNADRRTVSIDWSRGYRPEALR